MFISLFFHIIKFPMVGFLSGHHTGLPLRTVTAERQKGLRRNFSALLLVIGHRRTFFSRTDKTDFVFRMMDDDGPFIRKEIHQKCFDLEGRPGKLASHRRALFVFAAIDFCRAVAADKRIDRHLKRIPGRSCLRSPFTSFPFNRTANRIVRDVKNNKRVMN